MKDMTFGKTPNASQPNKIGTIEVGGIADSEHKLNFTMPNETMTDRRLSHDQSVMQHRT